MKVLITGGAGFIGKYCAMLLREKGHNVSIIDSLSPQIHGDSPDISWMSDNNIQFVKGDVRNIEALKPLVQSAESIIHLVSETGTGQSMYDIDNYTSVNLQGTANLIHVLANEKHDVKRVVLSSSRSIYGEGKYFCEEHGAVFPDSRNEEDLTNGFFELRCPTCSKKAKLVNTTEDSPANPLSYYALTKKIQEEMLTYAAKNHDFTYNILRYQNVYGPGQSLKNPYTGILSIFTNLVKLKKQEINIFEDGEESRDFVFVTDVAAATVRMATDLDIKNQTINIGAGVSTSVMEVAQAIKNYFNSDIELKVSGDYRLGDIRHNIADLTKAKSLIGFEPTVQFQDGIKQFLEWADKEDSGEDLYQKSLSEMKEKGLLKSN